MLAVVAALAAVLVVVLDVVVVFVFMCVWKGGRIVVGFYLVVVRVVVGNIQK